MAKKLYNNFVRQDEVHNHEARTLWKPYLKNHREIESKALEDPQTFPIFTYENCTREMVKHVTLRSHFPVRNTSAILAAGKLAQGG